MYPDVFWYHLDKVCGKWFANVFEKWGFELTGGFIQWRIRPKTKKSRLVGWIHWRRLQPRRELLRDREPPLPKDVWTTVTSYGLKVANELENLNLGLLGSTFELSFFPKNCSRLRIVQSSSKNLDHLSGRFEMSLESSRPLFSWIVRWPGKSPCFPTYLQIIKHRWANLK